MHVAVPRRVFLPSLWNGRDRPLLVTRSVPGRSGADRVQVVFSRYLLRTVILFVVIGGIKSVCHVRARKVHRPDRSVRL